MLLIYLPAITTRSKYVFDFIFINKLGLEYSVTTDIKTFKESNNEKINYSASRIGDEIFVNASTLLFKKIIEKINIPLEKKNGVTVLFPNYESCDVGFDIFSAVFYMVSRYEEYLPFIPDNHGRFKAEDSLAYQNNFLQYPVVDIWIKQFKNILSKTIPTLTFKTSTFNSIITYDIDIAYAYRGRNGFRMTGAFAKDLITLNFKNIFQRCKTLLNKKDPWDVYDYLEKTIIKNSLTSVFFFLLGKYSRYNKNIVWDHPLMVSVIKKIAEFSNIGIHPSYESSTTPNKIAFEKTSLEKILNRKIIKSRQHYLRFNLPETYNNLLTAGITEDYSMGFANAAGFRAGTCTPFYFYDLKNEQSTDLKIFPAACMDANFLYYSKSNPSESLQIINALIKEVKNVDGTFISIWHNNTISNIGMYKGWQRVHDEMIKKICDNKNM